MKRINSKISIFSTIQQLVKNNIKTLILAFSFLLIVFIIFQIYSFSQKKRIHELSILYNNSINVDSQSEFLENMHLVADEKNLYGLMASFEIINYKIKNNNYDGSYEEYLLLLNNKHVDNLYRTFVAIHASYNLLGKINSDQIINLLTYVDDGLDSFIGYHLEILYLLSLSQNNVDKITSLYDQIINNDNISSTIKERVKKLNEFNQYK